MSEQVHKEAIFSKAIKTKSTTDSTSLSEVNRLGTFNAAVRTLPFVPTDIPGSRCYLGFPIGAPTRS